MPDELWDRLGPLLPQRERCFRTRAAGRCRTGEVLCGIRYMVHSGLQSNLPKELGSGSGMTCWQRLRDWNEASIWQRPHEVPPAELNAAARPGQSRCVVDSSHVRTLKGGSTRAHRRPPGTGPAPNIT
ncbi:MULTISPECIES: transposase [unclassified Streptomyces]|uniref:transposase n=1 Tax=unclassified Streptomyces TaxID=2593676 RepID=UPI0013649423